MSIAFDFADGSVCGVRKEIISVSIPQHYHELNVRWQRKSQPLRREAFTLIMLNLSEDFQQAVGSEETFWQAMRIISV